MTEFRDNWTTGRDFDDDMRDFGGGAVRAALGTASRPPATDRTKISATPFRWPDHRSLPRRPWIWGRWLLRDTVSAIVAPGGIGKSSFVASMLLSLASGRENLLGRTVWGGPKTVWYWNLEDGMSELEMQLTAAALFHRVQQSECGSRIFLDSGPDGAELCITVEEEGGCTIAKPVVEALTAELAARKVDVLVVDPFVSSHGAPENDNGAIDRVVKAWTRIAKRAGCAVVLVHHTKKMAGEKVTAESSRGAVSLIAAARITLVLNRMDKDEAKRFGITDESERRRLFTVLDDKANRAPAEDAQWFRLASQDVDNSTGPDDPWGEHGDSVGVVTRWTPPDAFEGLSSDHLLRVQQQIASGAWKENIQAKDWAGFAIADALGLDASKDPGSDRGRISQLLRTWINTGALVVVQRRDPAKREDKAYVEVGNWADDRSAPPAASGAGKVGRSGAPEAPRPTSPLIGGGGGAPGGAQVKQVGHFAFERGSAKAILAPGETLDDPIPGWDFE